ncbi:peptidoglycan-associated lipoprotein Pal [Shimia biformata]|uniref:peptidoglycan-associated lipoprotein Pal n=1 Tax=Shimia biformata TaxID=1294299 RepID=UPI0019528446|nr:peptidoglycan-associated lipoprotein Pal [Shimia biformata]
MKHMTRIALVLGALTLAACANPGGSGSGPFSNPSANGITPGSVSDETSPAYFQQAIGDRILFEVDQSSLNEDARLVLLAQANWLMANTDYDAVIEGHADEQGTREYNLALGARRANAVKEFLVSQGVAGARLRTVSYGKERPIEICSDEACYAQNRRAVTVLSAAGLSG